MPALSLSKRPAMLLFAGSTRKEYAVIVPKAGNPLRSKLRVELTLRG